MGVGLVGAGRSADLHVAALRTLGISFAGLGSSSPARTAEAARRLGAQRPFDDLDAMLRDPRIDVVHVVTPSALHFDQVARALDTGKHVLCEKPLATTALEAERLARQADLAGLIGAVAYPYRFHPVVCEMRDRIGLVGRPLLVRASYLQGWLLDADPGEWRLDPERAGGSRALTDIGCHAIDLVEFVTGERVRGVSAVIGQAVPEARSGPGAADDSAVVSLDLSGGAIGSLIVSQVAIGAVNALTLDVYGTAGSATAALGDETRLEVAPADAAAGVGSSNGRGGPGGASTPPSVYVDAYVDLFRAFHQAIIGARPAELPGFHDCARVLAVRDAVLRAAAGGAREDVGSGVLAGARPEAG